MRTSCCNAKIVVSSLRHIHYCKRCKRVLDDDLIEQLKEKQTCDATTSTKAEAQENSANMPQEQSEQTSHRRHSAADTGGNT